MGGGLCGARVDSDDEIDDEGSAYREEEEEEEEKKVHGGKLGTTFLGKEEIEYKAPSTAQQIYRQ